MNWRFILLVATAFLLCGILSYYRGKRSADRYYAAHPVVKYEMYQATNGAISEIECDVSICKWDEACKPSTAAKSDR